MVTTGQPPGRVLVLAGGPDFHQPGRVAGRLAELLRDSAGPPLTLDVVDDLAVLSDTDRLQACALLVVLWTWGELEPDQQDGLALAVSSGTGLAGVHGAATAFPLSPAYRAALGGQFVEHPGDEDVGYRVDVATDHPAAAGLAGFEVRTEQYYLHVAPDVEVLASTRMEPGRSPVVAGRPVTVPVAWTRTYGSGRVSYCALGHRPEVFDSPGAAALTVRCLRWAARALPTDG